MARGIQTEKRKDFLRRSGTVVTTHRGFASILRADAYPKKYPMLKRLIHFDEETFLCINDESRSVMDLKSIPSKRTRAIVFSFTIAVSHRTTRMEEIHASLVDQT